MPRKSGSKMEGRFTVSGPYEDERSASSVGAGISLAQTLATRHRKITEELTYYVRELGGALRATVTKTADGVVLTRST